MGGRSRTAEDGGQSWRAGRGGRGAVMEDGGSGAVTEGRGRGQSWRVGGHGMGTIIEGKRMGDGGRSWRAGEHPHAGGPAAGVCTCPAPSPRPRAQKPCPEPGGGTEARLTHGKQAPILSTTATQHATAPGPSETSVPFSRNPQPHGKPAAFISHDYDNRSSLSGH